MSCTDHSVHRSTFVDSSQLENTHTSISRYQITNTSTDLTTHHAAGYINRITHFQHIVLKLISQHIANCTYGVSVADMPRLGSVTQHVIALPMNVIAMPTTHNATQWLTPTHLHLVLLMHIRVIIESTGSHTSRIHAHYTKPHQHRCHDSQYR